MRSVSDKWAKTEVLQKKQDVAAHLPPMRPYGSSELEQMLDLYDRVVAKPVKGSGGGGVLFVGRRGQGYYLKNGREVRHYRSLADLQGGIDRLRRGRKYFLQRWISLAEIGGRPVDYRVKLVKEGNAWKLKALVGRVASPGLSVTNLAKGGIQLKGAEAIRRSLPSIRAVAKKREMRRLAYTCTRLLEEAFPGIGSLGYDFGLDRSGRIWILEVNTQPR